MYVCMYVCVCVCGGGVNASATARVISSGEAMMKSVFWWRNPEYPEETTDLRQVTDGRWFPPGTPVSSTRKLIACREGGRKGRREEGA